jgi:hypothetical protein
MKRFPILGGLLIIPAALMLVAVGCNTGGPKGADKGAAADKGKDKGGDKGGEKGGDKGGAKGKNEPITTPLEATVSGTVKFKGKAPERVDVKALLEHKDADACKKGDTKEQLWIVDNDGGVDNVVISLAPPSGKKFDLDKVKDLSKKTVHLDQPACAYVPHVVALWPEVQPLVAKNTATVNHNVKIEGGPVIGTKDFTILPGKDSGEVWLKGAGETVINTTCSIHQFMNAKIALFTHPYFGVTDAKGKYTIKNVPIDTELTVYMWHESMPSKVEQKKMSFKKGDNTVDLEIGK